MIDVIGRIINLSQMQAAVMGILMTNTQKALHEFAPYDKGIGGPQDERLNKSSKSVTTGVGDMLTRFWFQTERKQREHEPMSGDEIKNIRDFVSFVRNLIENMRSLPNHFQSIDNQTFEAEFDKKLQEVEAYTKKRLQEFDEALDGTGKGLKSRLGKSVRSVFKHIGKPFMRSEFPAR
jgi:deoxyribodipyrimidine photolyase